MVHVIEKTDIRKTPASGNVLKNRHVVINFQLNKKNVKRSLKAYIKCVHRENSSSL